ncbi:MAG: hypothetical protein EBU33_10040, partial [Sphingobacteriia bacterium]|nr:hypothetical protein [Sphingobacteriia bacterium]
MFLIDVISFNRATELARVLSCPAELFIKWKLTHELHCALTKNKNMCLEKRNLSQSLTSSTGFNVYVKKLARQHQPPYDTSEDEYDEHDLNSIPPENNTNDIFYYTTVSGSRDIIMHSKRIFVEPIVVTNNGFFYLGPVYKHETQVVQYILDYGNNNDSSQPQILDATAELERVSQNQQQLEQVQAEKVRARVQAFGQIEALIEGGEKSLVFLVHEWERLEKENMATQERVASENVADDTNDNSSQPLILDDTQKQFVKTILSARNGVHILTGGAGTGKTRTILELLRLNTGYTYICAPTGKAVANIRQKLVYDNDLFFISTIHFVLYNENAKNLFREASLIIIDEFSMVDLPLFSRLLTQVYGTPR